MIASIVFRDSVKNFVLKNKKMLSDHIWERHKCYLNICGVEDSIACLRTKEIPNIISNNYFPPVWIDQRRYYTNTDRKNLNYNLEKSKQIIKDNIHLKRIRLRERKEILVQGIFSKNNFL